MNTSKYHLDWHKHLHTSRIDDQYPEILQFHNSLSRWHHNIQQNPRRTSDTDQTGFWKTPFSKTFMKLSKCYFFSKDIQYLGHILSTKGIHPLPSKTQAIQQMQPPTTPKQVWAFLRLVRYYRKFIKNFAKIANLWHSLPDNRSSLIGHHYTIQLS